MKLNTKQHITKDGIVKRNPSPYYLNNGTIVRIKNIDNRYYITYYYPDGTELIARHSYDSIYDAERRRNEIVEMDIYDATIELEDNRYRYTFPDKGTITVVASDKYQAVEKILQEIGK